MDLESGVCILCDKNVKVLNGDDSQRFLTYLCKIFNRRCLEETENDKQRLCVLCAGEIKHLLNFYESHVKNGNGKSACFICGTESIISIKSEDSPEELNGAVKIFEEAFYKKYDVKELVCFECVYSLKCWNQILDVVLSKKLVGDVLPMKLIKKVSFSPMKEYISTGRMSPLQLSPTSSSTGSPSRPISPDITTPRLSARRKMLKRRISIRGPIKDQLNHLKPVSSLLKGRGKKININNVTDEKMLNAVPYIEMTEYTELNYLVQHPDGPLKLPSMKQTKLSLRKELLGAPDSSDESEGELINLDEESAGSVDSNSSKTDESSLSNRPIRRAKVTPKPKPTTNKFKISNMIFKRSLNSPLLSPTQKTFTCKMCDETFKSSLEYNTHIFKHKNKLELKVNVCRSDLESIRNSISPTPDKTSPVEMLLPQSVNRLIRKYNDVEDQGEAEEMSVDEECNKNITSEDVEMESDKENDRREMNDSEKSEDVLENVLEKGKNTVEKADEEEKDKEEVTSSKEGGGDSEKNNENSSSEENGNVSEEGVNTSKETEEDVREEEMDNVARYKGDSEGTVHEGEGGDELPDKEVNEDNSEQNRKENGVIEMGNQDHRTNESDHDEGAEDQDAKEKEGNAGLALKRNMEAEDKANKEYQNNGTKESRECEDAEENKAREDYEVEEGKNEDEKNATEEGSTGNIGVETVEESMKSNTTATEDAFNKDSNGLSGKIDAKDASARSNGDDIRGVLEGSAESAGVNAFNSNEDILLALSESAQVDGEEVVDELFDLRCEIDKLNENGLSSDSKVDAADGSKRKRVDDCMEADGDFHESKRIRLGNEGDTVE